VKHEDVPGYTDLRAELFRARYELEVAKTEEEFSSAKSKVKEIKRKIAKAMFDYNEEKREEVKKGK